MKTVILSVKERLELPSILPPKGGYIQQEIVSFIKDLIKFSPMEIEEYEMKDLPGGKVMWNSDKEKDKEYLIQESFIEVMLTGIDLLDKAESIPTVLFSLCKKIKSIQ